MKDGQAARALLVGLVTREHRGGQVIQVPRAQLAHQDTVTRTPVWGTTSEVNTTQLLFKNTTSLSHQNNNKKRSLRHSEVVWDHGSCRYYHTTSTVDENHVLGRGNVV